MSGPTCPSREELFGCLVGTLPEDTAEHVIDHCGTCPDCRALLDTFDEADDTLVARLRCPAADGEHSAEPEYRQAVARVKAAAGSLSPPADKASPAPD